MCARQGRTRDCRIVEDPRRCRRHPILAIRWSWHPRDVKVKNVLKDVMMSGTGARRRSLVAQAAAGRAEIGLR